MVWKKEFACGVAISVFCIFNMTFAWITRPQTAAAAKLSFFARTEIWLLFWLGLMLILGIALAAKALRSRDTQQGQQASKPLFSAMILITIGVLILYFIALDRIGFTISTFLMLMALMSALSFGMGKLTRGNRVKALCIQAVVAVLAVTVIYVLFSNILNQMLPRGLWI